MELLKLFAAYSLIFFIFRIIKKLRKITVYIHGIWFSTDGSVPQSIFDNLSRLMVDIKQSVYRDNYKIILWTDTRKLKPEVNKRLKQIGVTARHYQHYKPRTAIAKQVSAWIHQLVNTEYGNYKMHFAMASDILRMYLLFYALPQMFSKTVHCYMDCNDIGITEIPSPAKLNRINGIAFNILPIESFAFVEFIEREKFFCFTNNDLIITSRLNKQVRSDIFHAYHSYLTYIDHFTTGLIDMYLKTLKSGDNIHRDVKVIMVFLVTHITNILSLIENPYGKIYLFNYSDDGLVAKTIAGIRDASLYISFERLQDHSLTWLENAKLEECDDEKTLIYHKYWKDAVTQGCNQRSLCLDKI